jgi:hypothetical protein
MTWHVAKGHQVGAQHLLDFAEEDGLLEALLHG